MVCIGRIASEDCRGTAIGLLFPRESCLRIRYRLTSFRDPCSQKSEAEVSLGKLAAVIRLVVKRQDILQFSPGLLPIRSRVRFWKTSERTEVAQDGRVRAFSLRNAWRVLCLTLTLSGSAGFNIAAEALLVYVS